MDTYLNSARALNRERRLQDEAIAAAAAPVIELPPKALPKPVEEPTPSGRRYSTRATTSAVAAVEQLHQLVSLDEHHKYELQTGGDQFVQCHHCGKWRKLPLNRDGSLAVDLADESQFPETYGLMIFREPFRN